MLDHVSDKHEDNIETTIEVLRQRFGNKLQTGEAIRSQHAHTTTNLPSQLPDAVIFVESAEDAESEKEGEEKEKEGEEKIGSDFSQIMLLSSLKYGVQYSHLDEGSSVPRELETPPPELKA